MNKLRFARLETLFEQASKRPPEERSSFLEKTCVDDPELLVEVLGLLEMEGQDEALVEELVGALEFPSVDGQYAIGRYRLVGELGSGGMGAVYIAERADQEFEKRVALKVMSSRLGEERLVERFRSERQILANLEHPNIARLIDGGTLDDGRPYLVMELVEGELITRYCDAHRLTIDQRIELFCEVCAAVQHAHRNLVVHRDIKPSNILVSKDGSPKLLDFGIAKLVETPEGAPLETTDVNQRFFTPEYASPEQVSGRRITTATDVYALGVLLYELLTGKRPFRGGMSSPADIERRLTGAGIERPSARSGLNTEQARRLKGDLDSIVLKALASEPEQRYGSPAALAEDLCRHQTGLPVLARADDVRYRAVKFLLRNRSLLAALTLVALTMVVATAVSVRFAVQADHQRREAERQTEISGAVIDFLNEDLLAQSNPYVQPDRDLTLRQAIDIAAEAAGERFAAEPLIEAAIRRTLGSAYEGLGEYERAAENYDRSFLLRRNALGSDDEKTLEAMSARIAGLYYLGRVEEALPEVGELVARCESELGLDHQLTAQALNLQAVLHGRVDQGREIEILERAVQVHRRAFGADHAETLTVINNLAIAYDDLGRHSEARSLYEEVLEKRLEIRSADHPDTLLTKISLGTNAMYRGELEQAEQILIDALVEMEPALGAEHPMTTATVGLLGRVYKEQGHFERALETFERVLEVQRRTQRVEAHMLVQSQVNVMGMYSILGRHDQAIAIGRNLLTQERESGGGRLRLALARLANELRAAGRCAEARPLIVEADPNRRVPSLSGDTALLLSVRGLCNHELDDETAREDLQRAFDLLESADRKAHPMMSVVSTALLEIQAGTPEATERAPARRLAAD